MVRGLLLFALVTGSLVACSLDPQDPPYVGCVPACAAGETCFRGGCVRTTPRPDPCSAVDGGRCADAAAGD